MAGTDASVKSRKKCKTTDFRNMKEIDVVTRMVRMRFAGACLLLPLAAWGQTGQVGSKWWADSKAELAAEGGSQSAQSDEVEPSATEHDVAVVSESSELAAPVILAGQASLEDFDCVEVRRFEVFSDFITSKQDARAATIPMEKLGALQREVAGQVPEKIRGLKSTLVVEGAPQCPDPKRALVLGGRITDFKAGNQALRYLVGFGAGAQKFSVLVRATRKSDGAVVAEGEVTDRKVGGWLGGQDDKGMEDFAEKVAGFLKQTLQAR